MNKEREALQKIANKNNQPLATTINGLRTQLRFVLNIATEALKEPTERCYSEEEVFRKAIQFGKELQQGLHGDVLISDFLQSLSPKEGKEESANYVARVCEKHFWGLVETTATGQEPTTHIQCMYCGASKENGFKHTEPNQTEAEKEADKFIRDNMALPSYLPLESFAPSMRLSYDLAFKSYLESRKQVIEEIEEWVKENTESVENQSGDRGGAIWTSELLTYLQTLKP